MHTKHGHRKNVESDFEYKKVLRKAQRDGVAFRSWTQYIDRHACAAGRQEERRRIMRSGQYEMRCWICSGRPGWVCHHPHYRVTYQCVNCRYLCHDREKAKAHSSGHGHHLKLVDLQWHTTTFESPIPVVQKHQREEKERRRERREFMRMFYG